MKGRDRSLARARALITSGQSVDVVGSRGSGRTTFLHALKQSLLEDEWNIVSIRGLASLKQHPLAALHLSVFLGGQGPAAPLNLQETARALIARLQVPRSALFIDDWDDLDETSWGIIESARRSTDVPIVLSRLQGVLARHTPSGLPASSLEQSFVVDMTPLRFEDLETAIVDRLDGPVDPLALTRIFAKSGGNIGLALSIVEAAAFEGHLVRRVDGVWIAVGELWSPTLRGVLERHLASLSSEAKDALEIIAMVGVADISTVRSMVDWGQLELLEERAMVAFVPGSPNTLVTVVPPLLVEYFRHEPLSARRTRLTELMMERLGRSDFENALLPERTLSSPNTLIGQDALFISLLRERARAQRVVTRFEWEARPSRSTARRYIEALMQSQSSELNGLAAQVFEQAHTLPTESTADIDFIVLRATWLAYVDGVVDDAIQYLDRNRSHIDAHDRIIDATEVRILTDLRSVPDDYESKLEVTEETPALAKLPLLEAQMFVLVNQCRFADAIRVYGEIKCLQISDTHYFPRYLYCVALLGIGDQEEALRLMTIGLTESRSYLDPVSFRGYGAALALCHLHSGDHTALRDLLDVLLASGEPTPLPPGSSIMISAAESILASHRGQSVHSDHYLGDTARFKITAGALPGDTRTWMRCKTLAIEGKTTEAAEVLWEAAESLEQRGALVGSLHQRAISLELDPHRPERLRYTEQMLQAYPENRTLAAQVAYASAIAEHDPEALVRAAHSLEQVGRLGMALAASQRAVVLFRERKDKDREEAAKQVGRRIRQSARGSTLNDTRFDVASASLSAREREVAQLAAEGLTNVEIAARLVLSVRTVESHMLRIMRKLQVQSRDAIHLHLR